MKKDKGFFFFFSFIKKKKRKKDRVFKLGIEMLQVGDENIRANVDLSYMKDSWVRAYLTLNTRPCSARIWLWPL